MSIVVDRNMAACFRDVDFITAARTVTGVPEKDSKDMHYYATALGLQLGRIPCEVRSSGNFSEQR